MKKIIQIQADHGKLFALAEDGLVYIRTHKEEQVCDGDQYKD